MAIITKKSMLSGNINSIELNVTQDQLNQLLALGNVNRDSPPQLEAAPNQIAETRTEVGYLVR